MELSTTAWNAHTESVSHLQHRLDTRTSSNGFIVQQVYEWAQLTMATASTEYNKLHNQIKKFNCLKPEDTADQDMKSDKDDELSPVDENKLFLSSMSSNKSQKRQLQKNTSEASNTSGAATKKRKRFK